MMIVHISKGIGSINKTKHNIGFEEAQFVFFDSNRIIAEDIGHKASEERFFCIGKIDGEFAL